MQRMHYFGGLGFRVFFSARPRCVKVVKVTLGASETMGFPDSFPTYLFGHGPPFLNPSARDDAPATPTTQPNPKRSEDNDAGMNQPAPLPRLWTLWTPGSPGLRCNYLPCGNVLPTHIIHHCDNILHPCLCSVTLGFRIFVLADRSIGNRASTWGLAAFDVLY